MSSMNKVKHHYDVAQYNMNYIPVKVTLDISRSPIDFQWGSWKYPG